MNIQCLLLICFLLFTLSALLLHDQKSKSERVRIVPFMNNHYSHRSDIHNTTQYNMKCIAVMYKPRCKNKLDERILSQFIEKSPIRNLVSYRISKLLYC